MTDSSRSKLVILKSFMSFHLKEPKLHHRHDQSQMVFLPHQSHSKPLLPFLTHHKEGILAFYQEVQPLHLIAVQVLA